MEKKNVTTISKVYLLGLQTPQSLTSLIFLLLLVIYCIIICGNLLIITLVSSSKTLQCPMYFFLCHLSILDILLVTDILPNMLYIILVKEDTMPLSHCLTQFFFFGVSEITECLLLAVMSYDRYLAICKPLHYTLLMTWRFCWILAIAVWAVGILLLLNDLITISQLWFCGPNIVDHFFCDLAPILHLSCSDTTLVQLEIKLWGALFVVTPFLLIIISYIYILVTILKIPSLSGRKKAFSTCSSHLIVISILYVTMASVYMLPSRGQPWTISKFLSLMYTVVTPLMNPLIYSLRNKDFNTAIQKLINTM
ncbi:olfactory receptor 1M1-like [Gastrophryne carolinensis]